MLGKAVCSGSPLSSVLEVAAVPAICVDTFASSMTGKIEVVVVHPEGLLSRRAGNVGGGDFTDFEL